MGWSLGRTFSPWVGCRASSRAGKPAKACTSMAVSISFVYHIKKKSYRFKSCKDICSQCQGVRKKVVWLDSDSLRCANQPADLLHDGRSCEPMVFLQDSFWEVLGQTREVVLPHIGQILAVVHTGGLIPGYESFDEPARERQTEVWLLTLFLNHPFEIDSVKICFGEQKSCQY